MDFPLITIDGNLISSLEECFENYQKPKKIIDDSCPNCKNIEMIAIYIILEIPPVLIINLKRVGEQSIYNHYIKIPHQLDMGKVIKNFINFSPSIYELRGFIKNNGDEYSGHNYSVLKNMFDDNWYINNDNYICRCINESEKSNDIVFLCYIKTLSQSKI